MWRNAGSGGIRHSTNLFTYFFFCFTRQIRIRVENDEIQTQHRRWLQTDMISFWKWNWWISSRIFWPADERFSWKKSLAAETQKKTCLQSGFNLDGMEDGRRCHVETNGVSYLHFQWNATTYRPGTWKLRKWRFIFCLIWCWFWFDWIFVSCCGFFVGFFGVFGTTDWDGFGNRREKKDDDLEMGIGAREEAAARLKSIAVKCLDFGWNSSTKHGCK